MDEEASRKAERVKALLAGYYGAGGDAGAGTGPGGAQAGAGPQQPSSQAGVDASGRNMFRKGGTAAVASAAFATSVDSPAFDANQHLLALLKASSLERLMVEHRNTAKEIKNLDTDMQQLVTENYHKFITATDTIRVMKGEVDKAMPELSKLSTIMNNVSERSTTISTKLQARQDKMEELYRVQALLQKLQAVFDLPKRMRAALEEDVLDTAVTFYAEAQPLLKKYGHKGTFRQIAADSDLVAKEISQVLKRRLAERKDDTETCVLLLRKLGEPDDTLQDRYLVGRATRLRKILKDASGVVDIMAAASVAASAPAGTAARSSATAAVAAGRTGVEAPGTWGFGDDGTPPTLRQFVRALDEKLINAVQETVMNVMRFFMSKDLSEEAAAAKRRPLVALAKEVFADYFALVRRAVADHVAASVGEASKSFAVAAAAAAAGPAPGAGARSEELSVNSPLVALSTSWGAEGLAQALSTLSADLSLISGGLTELSLRERAAALVAGAVQHHLDACFGALRGRVVGAAATLSARLAATQPGGGLAGAGGGADGDGAGLLRRAYAYLSELTSRGLEAVMQGLKAYEAQQRLLSNCYPDFMTGLQSALQRWFVELLSSLQTLGGLRLDTSAPAGALGSSGRLARGSTSALTGSKGAAEEGAASAGDGWTPSPPMAALLATLGPAAGGAATPAGAAPGGGADAYARTGLVLALARLCTHLEQNTVPWAMENLAGFFAGRAMPSGASSNPDQPPAFIPGEVGRRLGSGSAALLAAYVELHGRQLSLMVRRSVAATTWLHHKEPRGPRPVCDLLVERLGKAETEVVQLVDDTGRRTDAAATNATLAASRANERGFGAGLLLETGNVERNLAKIFREKVKVFGGAVQFTQAAILGSIAGVGLKSLVECIRLQTLGRAGLQQLQLDAHYLRPQLRRYTGGRMQQVVDSLLDEVVAAGVERSLDPTLLEPGVLDRILSSMAMDS